MEKAEVAEAMQALAAQGKSTGTKAIRAYLGYGSYQIIQQFRQELLAAQGGDDMPGKLQTGDALKLIDQLRREGVPDADLGKALHERYQVVPSELVKALNTPEAQRVVDPALHDLLMTDEYLVQAAKLEGPVERRQEPMEVPDVPAPRPDPRSAPVTLTPHEQAYIEVIEAHLQACQLCTTGRRQHWMCCYDGGWHSYSARLPFTRGFIARSEDKSLGGEAINGCSEAHVDMWMQLQGEVDDMDQSARQRAAYERKMNALRRTGGLGIAR